VLRLLSEHGANILTISQNMPIHEVAHVTISLELSPHHPDAEDFIPMLGAIDGVSGVKLISIE
jgi:chorismate mutase